jgi:hypothetical protein
VVDDDLHAALEALLGEAAAPASAVRDEAVSLAAAVSRDSPDARHAWAEAFDERASRFDGAAATGAAYANHPTPVLTRLLADDGSAPTARTYARRLAELGMAAASLGDLTISALATASVIGNAQLVAAGESTVTAADAGPAAAAPSTPVAAVAAAAPSTPVAPDGTAAEPTPTLEELLAELDALVGLEAVKTEVRHQTQVLRIQALRDSAGLRNPDLTRHLVFVGNPGTGKTTVARLVARIYQAVGLLPQGHLVECDRSELVAGYLGQTALKTAEVGQGDGGPS